MAWKILQSRLGIAEETQTAVEVVEDPLETTTDITSVMPPETQPPDALESETLESETQTSDTLASETEAWDSQPFDTQPPDMQSRDELTLFASATPPRQGMVTFAGSVLTHVLAGALLWFGLAYRPPTSRIVTEHSRVREIDLETLAELEHARVPFPSPQKDAVKAVKARPKTPSPSHSMATPNQSLHPLIQPDLPNAVKMAQDIPVPRLVLWAASKTVVQKITPPALKRPAAPKVVPVLDRPNQEMRLADAAVSADNQLALKSHVIPSTTVPVAARDAIQTQQPLSSVSQLSAVPTPAAILSLSDIQLQKGTVILPPITSAPKSDSRAGLAPGQGKSSLLDSGNGASGAGADAFPGLTVTPIALSREGRFSSVVLGADLAEDYPELAGLWAGRPTYTAYLNVGLSKSWILQYSLPRSAGATDGRVTRLDAPWPYNIVRPNLAPDAINADALMVHGFINESGKFENLSVAFPQPFSMAHFVLNALEQWQFRPATRDGQAAKVEVLLIVPEIEE